MIVAMCMASWFYGYMVGGQECKPPGCDYGVLLRLEERTGFYRVTVIKHVVLALGIAGCGESIVCSKIQEFIKAGVNVRVEAELEEARDGR